MRPWPVGLIGLLIPLLCAGLWSWGTYNLAEKGYTGPFQRLSERDHQAVLCTAWVAGMSASLMFYEWCGKLGEKLWLVYSYEYQEICYGWCIQVLCVPSQEISYGWCILICAKPGDMLWLMYSSIMCAKPGDKLWVMYSYVCQAGRYAMAGVFFSVPSGEICYGVSPHWTHVVILRSL